MNKFVKITVLTLAALATVATTIQFADAGERYWRKHARPWHKRTVVVGVTAGVVAGAVIATRPRVIYSEAPVVVDEGPIYDRETVYGDEDMVYADPDQDYGRRVYRDDAPEAEDYAAPRDEYEDGDRQGYGDQQTYDPPATEDDYFPDRPQARVNRESTESIREQATIETAPRRHTKKTATIEEADAANLKPWTKQWRDYCSGRFSTFNPQNGTYLGYDQKRHFCKAG